MWAGSLHRLYFTVFRCSKTAHRDKILPQLDFHQDGQCAWSLNTTAHFTLKENIIKQQVYSLHYVGSRFLSTFFLFQAKLIYFHFLSFFCCNYGLGMWFAYRGKWAESSQCSVIPRKHMCSETTCKHPTCEEYTCEQKWDIKLYFYFQGCFFHKGNNTSLASVWSRVRELSL